MATTRAPALHRADGFSSAGNHTSAALPPVQLSPWVSPRHSRGQHPRPSQFRASQAQEATSRSPFLLCNSHLRHRPPTSGASTRRSTIEGFWRAKRPTSRSPFLLCNSHLPERPSTSGASTRRSPTSRCSSTRSHVSVAVPPVQLLPSGRVVCVRGPHPRFDHLSVFQARGPSRGQRSRARPPPPPTAAHAQRSTSSTASHAHGNHMVAAPPPGQLSPSGPPVHMRGPHPWINNSAAVSSTGGPIAVAVPRVRPAPCSRAHSS